MTRKEFITKSAVGISAISAIQSVMAQEHKHDAKMMKPKSKSKYAKAMMAAVHCKLAAEECLSQCLIELGKGDKTMAACAATTREVVSICDSFIMMASQNSNFISKIGDLCEDVCNACAKECKAHQEHFQECKDCMESCITCAKEMSKV
jgi:Cys-rich four helix bundle protein (predicted Tat secretion target)